jgi:hypothetical protein
MINGTTLRYKKINHIDMTCFTYRMIGGVTDEIIPSVIPSVIFNL